jgi:hypothetical protein
MKAKKLYEAPLWVALLLLASGCTNTLYRADLNVFNSEGQKRKSTLYWTKTDKLIGESKAGPIVLMTGCSTRRINFDDTAAGIVFRGTPGQDRIPGQNDFVLEGTVCGQIENVPRITELKSGPLLLMIKCEAINDEFSVRDGLYSSSYIQARDKPYRFIVFENSNLSLLGNIPEAPAPPECK